ncbi:MAG TPA: hypothetical protein VGS80_16210 [Ktedonobacterales bacterium]|nr:hypothetical protein [Ktedonobacterales bacterium]
MAKRYGSFLLRYWLVDGVEGQRIEIEHIQSGEHTLLSSLAAALDWIAAHAAAPASIRPTPRPTARSPSDGDSSGQH